jgi:hypothetical protein
MLQIKKIPVQEFLDNRKEELKLHEEEKQRLGNPSWYIIVNPDEEIICDSCNADIITEENPEFVYLDEGSNSAYCRDCASERESA